MRGELKKKLAIALGCVLIAHLLPAAVTGVRGTFSPDGRKIAFQRMVGGDIHLGILSLDDGRVEWVERSSGQAVFPFWAKDGRLVYSFGTVDPAARKAGQYRSEGFGVRIREGESVRTFPHGLWFEESPSMPDDGRCVWYASTKGIKHYDTCKQYPGEGFRAKIVRRDLSDGSVTTVHAISNSLMCGVRSPQVSPDGTRVAWSQLDAFRKSEMHVRVAATNDLRVSTVVSPADMTAYGPKWSSDGHFLCFTGFRAGDPGWSVYLARLSDNSVRRICTGENPSFSSDGRQIVYDDGRSLHLWDVTARCEIPLKSQDERPFRVLALVDSRDFDSVYDLSTVSGNLQVLDHVMSTFPTDVLWRDKGGGGVRYDSREDAVSDVRCLLDTRRLLDQGVNSFVNIATGGSEVFRVVARSCAERGVSFGIHTTYEENHRWPNSESPWNLRHPQFACRTLGGKPRTDTCSLSYPEVFEHKLRLVDERLALGPKTIFLDCCETRMGAWTPACEYVEPVIAAWRAKYGCEPPTDWKDPRWTALVAESVSRYLRAFGVRCHAVGVEFFIGISPVDDEDDFVYRQWAIDWKRLAAEGVFDGVVAMGVKVEETDPFGSTRRILAKTRESIGSAALYFQCSAYDCNFGYAMYARQLNMPFGEAAKKLVDMTKEIGGKGVILECVDYANYPEDVRQVLKAALMR